MDDTHGNYDRGLQLDAAEARKGGVVGLPAMVPGAEQPRPPTLEMLTAEFQRHQAHIVDALRRALTHARHAGAALCAIKERVRERELDWVPWVKENLQISDRKASMYMKFHREWHRLEELCRRNQQDIADLTITKANSMLAKNRGGGREGVGVEAAPDEQASRPATPALVEAWGAAVAAFSPIAARAPSSGVDRGSSRTTAALETPPGAPERVRAGDPPEVGPTPDASEGERTPDAPGGAGHGRARGEAVPGRVRRGRIGRPGAEPAG